MSAPLSARPRVPDSRQDFGGAGRWSVAVAIPARDEARHILPCLDSARVALGGRGGIVLAVNGSADDTYAKARTWFEITGTPGILLNLAETPRGGVGAVRHLAAGACADRLTPTGAVMTTDADSRVFADWVDANLADLRHADLVCGTVIPDPAEYARLPAAIARLGAIEGEYTALTLAVRRLIDPVPHDRDPTHMAAPGASLAFRLPLYDATGGFPALPSGEDRAFAAAAEGRGWRIRHSALPRVMTSCRLEGRAPRGMAAALAGRLAEADPLADEDLEPARQTVLRAHLSRTRRSCLARGRAADPARVRAEIALARLPRQRMRLSDLTRETPLLARALAVLSTQDQRQIA